VKGIATAPKHRCLPTYLGESRVKVLRSTTDIGSANRECGLVCEAVEGCSHCILSGFPHLSIVPLPGETCGIIDVWGGWLNSPWGLTFGNNSDNVWQDSLPQAWHPETEPTCNTFHLGPRTILMKTGPPETGLPVVQT
jgi:hypothetical protein